MCSTYVSSMRSVASTEKDKAWERLMQILGEVLSWNISVLTGLSYDEIVISPKNLEPVKTLLHWQLVMILCSLATGFTAGFSKATA